MYAQVEKPKDNKSPLSGNAVFQKQSGGESTFQFEDNRPESVKQRKLQEMASNSPQTKQSFQLQSLVDNHSIRQHQLIQKKENNTGLPDNLKSGIENLSGKSLDDVTVHRNSDKPAQLQAHAYAQGTDIHLASGQEKHLPHEAWHVVQQKQGRVKPTLQMKGKIKININDDAGLEKEADVMGVKAANHENKVTSLPLQRNINTKKEGSNSDISGLETLFPKREITQLKDTLQLFATSNIVIQRIHKETLATELGNGRITETKLSIGQAAWDCLLAEPDTFWPALDHFTAPQPHPIVNPVGQIAFLNLHLAPIELISAKEALTLVLYNPALAPVMYTYLHKYRMINARVHGVALAELVTAVNNPVVAETAMRAIAPYDYYTTVKGNVDVMAGGKAGAEINQEFINLRLDYSTNVTAQGLDHHLTSSEAKAIYRDGGKKAAFERLLNILLVYNGGSAGPLRTDMNNARQAKLDGRPVELQNRTTNHQRAAQLILTPVYAVGAPEIAANWCLAQAGQNLPLLKTCAEIMVAVNGNDALRTKLDPLNLAGKHALLDKLSITLNGQLSASEIKDLLDSLTGLNGTAISALVNLLHPSLNSRGIDTLVLDLAPSGGGAIDTFIRQYVPTLSGAQLSNLIKRLRPLSLANIDLYINPLIAGINLGQIYTLTNALNPGMAVIGTDILALTNTLVNTIANALTPVHFRELMLAMDGLPANTINTMVTELIALGINNGGNIRTRIQTMRGSLQTGVNESTDVTNLDGERIRSGPQIADSIGQIDPLSGGVAGDMLLYPKSGINPAGRNENLLWDDCDATVVRHATELPTDVSIRQQMALNALIAIGGNRQIAQQVFAEQEGRQVRLVGTGAQEDVISNAAGNGGHISSRHVFGTGGVVNNQIQLQNRANGDPTYPPCPGIAGAFTSAGDCRTGMRNSIAAQGWNWLRARIIRGQTSTFTANVAVNGMVAQNGMAINNAPTRVRVQLTGANVSGGFYVFEAWPLP